MNLGSGLRRAPRVLPAPWAPTLGAKGQEGQGSRTQMTQGLRATRKVQPQSCWPLTSKARLEGRRPELGPSGPASALGGGILFRPPQAAPLRVLSSLRTSAHQRPALLHRLSASKSARPGLSCRTTRPVCVCVCVRARTRACVHLVVQSSPIFATPQNVGGSDEF